MYTTIVEEILTRKSNDYVQRGMGRSASLDLAGKDLIESARTRLSQVDFFCFRAVVAGAGKRLKQESLF